MASHGGALVPVVGRADDDGVDVFAGEDLVVVAGGEDVVAPELLAVREAAVVAVGHGNQLDARNLHGDLGVSLALAARADQRDLDVIVGGHRLGRLGLHGGERVDSCAQHGGCGCRSCRPQKTSAIQFVHFRLLRRACIATHINIHRFARPVTSAVRPA